MKIKKYDNRNEIDTKYKWDLEAIYSNIDLYYKDMDKVKKILKKIKKFKGHVLDLSENLLKIMDLDQEVSTLFDKMINYINLNLELDTRDGFYNSKYKELLDFYSNLDLDLNFISEELKKLNNEILNSFLKEKPKLKKYEFDLRHTIKMNKHILSLESENLLSTLSPVLSVGEEIFSKLDDADSDFGEATDSKGIAHKITHGTFARYICGDDRVLRKNADEKYHEYYKKHANTISECLSSHIKTVCIISKLRGYSSPLEASLSNDDISIDFYNHFIKEINDNLPTLHRMMHITKKALKLDEMHIYDIRCKLDSKVKQDYTIEEMQSILLEALKPLGSEYIDGVKEAFNSNWVDYYETPGKRSGAFSVTSVSTKPYLLLNYTGSFDDLETFSHELGHSMHTYFSNKYQDPVDVVYPIFLAEIASTTNELLLNNYLLNNAKDKNFKKFILNNIISMYKSTIFRQAEFAEYQAIIYDKTQKGENLTKEDFTSIYYDLQKKYYGDEVIQDDYIKYECLRIPHLYYSFYVYKYATSLAIAYKFAYKILSNEPGAVESYIKFLSSGGKDYPLNILKECGIDVEKDNLLDYSIKMINNYMDEFEKLLD